jgi:hypothetical protein
MNNNSMFIFDSDGKKYVKSVEKIQYAVEDFNSISFHEFEAFDNRKTVIKELLAKFEHADKTNRMIITTRLLDYLKNDYSVLSEVQPFWDFIYELGDEFYVDDDENFIFNHSIKQRSKNKIAGCYYKSRIILRKDGSFKDIIYKFPLVKFFDKVPMFFKINCGLTTESRLFFLHVKIVRFSEIEDNEDRRHILKGITCFSTDVKDVGEYLPKLNINQSKKLVCTEMMFHVCELQQKYPDNKFVFTPFER